ncbi:DUF2946 family protein [Xylophilus sp. GW821-FHT01B05]
MHRLRTSAVLARLVLVWFLLAVGAAVASPLMQPQSLELICSGVGQLKLLVKHADGSSNSAQQGHTLDCPLCASVGAPPPVLAQAATVPHPLAYALQPVPAAHIAARTAAPLPARGPPLFL